MCHVNILTTLIINFLNNGIRILIASEPMVGYITDVLVLGLSYKFSGSAEGRL
jgi:hypothetical protein